MMTFNFCTNLSKDSPHLSLSLSLSLSPVIPPLSVPSRPGVCKRCVWVSVCVCEPEPQEPCRTPGTSMRMPSSRASAPRSWISWSTSCRRWTRRYESVGEGGARFVLACPAVGFWPVSQRPWRSDQTHQTDLQAFISFLKCTHQVSVSQFMHSAPHTALHLWGTFNAGRKKNRDNFHFQSNLVVHKTH